MNSNANDEDNADKYFPKTRTFFEDLFRLYDYPHFSIQRHDISTFNINVDSSVNDDYSDNSDTTIAMVGGYLILGTTEHSRHYFWILIASGSNRGEVWMMNTNGFYFPTNTRIKFHQWIDDWISGSDKINTSVWICGLYDIQLTNSRYHYNNNNYTSIYDSSTSNDNDQEEHGDSGTECSYDDDDDIDTDSDGLIIEPLLEQ